MTPEFMLWCVVAYLVWRNTAIDRDIRKLKWVQIQLIQDGEELENIRRRAAEITARKERQRASV